MPRQQHTITRNGETITIEYEKCTVDLTGDQDTVQVPLIYTDRMGQARRRRVRMEFSGAAADDLRATIVGAINARITDEYGD